MAAGLAGRSSTPQHFVHPGGAEVLPVILLWGLGTLTKPSNLFFVYILTCFVFYGILYSPFTVVSVSVVSVVTSCPSVSIHPSILKLRGDRAFPVVDQKLWNEPPLRIRPASMLSVFKSKLTCSLWRPRLSVKVAS